MGVLLFSGKLRFLKINNYGNGGVLASQSKKESGGFGLHERCAVDIKLGCADRRVQTCSVMTMMKPVMVVKFAYCLKIVDKLGKA
ncbi:hypothetical protein [Ewingella americana]|uniref:hypothetical protein n=1 Tax=Ewingella americana TaxID=41202 RepID=UPI00112E3245|nr:hypothetical protein [Ewingella americana]